MIAMTHLSVGLVVIGTMSPPITTWGMSAMGVSAIAASLEATTVESMSPTATAFIAVAISTASSSKKASGPPLKRSAKKTIPSRSVHWMMQKNDKSTYLEIT